MLDIADLDKALKVKMVGRLNSTLHPFLSLVKNQLTSSFFDLKVRVTVDEPIVYALNAIKSHRESLWDIEFLSSNTLLLNIIRDTRIIEVLLANGAGSLAYFNLRINGKEKIRDLTIEDLNSIRMFMGRNKRDKIANAIRIGRDLVTRDIRGCLWLKSTFKEIDVISSKEIRECLSEKASITSYKIGMNLTQRLNNTWLYRLSKITSTVHKNVILKVLHGDIYSMEKLARYGLTPDNSCPRCGQVEDVQHKFFRCDYATRIWEHLKRVTNIEPNHDNLEFAFGVHSGQNHLPLHAEILKRLLSLPREQDYLIRPRVFVENAAKALIKREKNVEIKRSLEAILS